jgi:hypothetical protein
MRNVHATLAAGALALLTGCIFDGRTAGATGVGNPTKGSVTVAMVALDSLPPAKAAGKAAAAVRNPDGSFDIRDAEGTVFTVRSGYANVGRLRIALPDSLDCSDDGENECASGEVTLRGPWVSDLMTGTWSPDPGAVKLPVGAYRQVEVRLEAQEDRHAAGPDLSRHSLIFAGTFTWRGRADRPFSIALDFDEDIRFESAGALAVDTGSNALTIALDIAAWLSRADITACLEDGSLALDASGGFSFEKGRGCGVEQQVKDAVKASGSVREERDD